MARLLAFSFASVLAFGGLSGCTGDQPQTQEPVSDAPPSIPDAPGDSTAPKPAEPPKVEPAPTPANEKTVIPATLNVRDAASSTGKVLRKLKKGDKVQVESCAKGWCKLTGGGFVGQKQLQ